MNIIDQIKLNLYRLDDESWYIVSGAVIGYASLACIVIVGFLL